MTEKKKNIPLIIALSIPILMVILITISIYVPTLFVKPKFDFIYSVENTYCYHRKHSVQDERVVFSEVSNKKENDICRNNQQPRLYYYDVQSFTSKEITLEEAQEYRLDCRRHSQDGFEIVSGDRSFDIFFISGSSYYDKYLKKGAYSRRIHLENHHYYDFRFLGWIKE